jgi:hypothetical protein
MKPQTRTLIWEQWRVAGITALWMFCFSAPLMLLMWALFHLSAIHRYDAVNISMAVCVYATLTSAMVFMLRFDTAGHLTASFDQRLSRLPVRTWPLVSVPFVTRLAYLGLLLFSLVLLHWVLFGEWAETLWVLLPFTCYAIAQAYAWSRRAITGLDYLLPLALFLAPLVIFRLHLTQLGYLDGFVILARAMASPALFPFVLLGAFSVGLLGVHWDRRDIRRGLPTLADVLDVLRGQRMPRARDLESPLAALVWYEGRRAGGRMLAAYAVVTAVAAIIVVNIPALEDQASLFAQFLPLVALPIAALIHSVTALWSKSNHAMLRPVDTRTLAHAKLIATARALTWTTLLAVVLSLAAYYVTARNAEFLLIAQAFDGGEISLPEITAMLLGPCLIAFAAAWACSAFGTGLTGALAFFTVIGTVLASYALTSGAGLLSQGTAIYFAVVLIPCVLVAVSLVQATRKQLISRAAAAALVILWLGIAGYLFAIGPHTVTVVYSVELDEHPIYGTPIKPGEHVSWKTIAFPTPLWAGLPGLAVGAVLVAPFTGIAHATRRRRVS